MMSFNNLTSLQGNELAKLLMGLGRALVLASIVALLFPHEGEDLRIVWSLLGMIVGGVFAVTGVFMLRIYFKTGFAEYPSTGRPL